MTETFTLPEPPKSGRVIDGEGDLWELEDGEWVFGEGIDRLTWGQLIENWGPLKEASPIRNPKVGDSYAYYSPGRDSYYFLVFNGDGWDRYAFDGYIEYIDTAPESNIRHPLDYHPDSKVIVIKEG